jgi:hypothetical protein
MPEMRATITATSAETRILIEDDSGDRLIARLEPLRLAAHGRALPTLLEALALWGGQMLTVVMYVDESFDWTHSGLADALGFGLETLFYRVEIVPLGAHRRRRPKRLSGLGSFASERRGRRRVG